MVLFLLQRALWVLIFAYVILAWFPALRDQPFGRLVNQLVEPMLAPIRRVVPTLTLQGGVSLDLSPLVFIVLVQVVFYVIGRIGISF